jgi:hypothetical protein
LTLFAVTWIEADDGEASADALDDAAIVRERTAWTCDELVNEAAHMISA